MRRSQLRVGGARRRSVVKERFWRHHLSRQAAGVLSIRAYCERHGLAEPSFYSWRRELAQRDQSAGRSRLRSPSPMSRSRPAARAVRDSRSVQFVRLDVPPQSASASSTIEIVLHSGVRVLVPSGAARGPLREVLAALGLVTDREDLPC